MKSIIIISIFLNSLVGAETSVDLKQAEDLAQKGKTLESMQIYSTCLKANSKKDFPDLEECLHKGEFYIVQLIEKLVKQNSGDDDPKLLEPYKKIGLDLEWGHYGEIKYNHDFFIKLKALYPQSKYREEVRYALIKHNISGTKGWQEHEKSLKEFLAEFPNGKFTSNAKFRLAVVYDNLWDLIRPSDDEYHKAFSTGNEKKDIKSSNEYQKKSLKLYNEVLESTNSPRLSEEDKSYAKQRSVDLKAGKKGSVYSVLND